MNLLLEFKKITFHILFIAQYFMILFIILKVVSLSKILNNISCIRRFVERL